MASLFKSVKANHVKRNKFNLSHEIKLTTEFGRLTPFFVRETVPGDKYRLSMDCLCRMAPLYAPVMHRVNLFVHYFFVPNRLLQKNWETFITGGEDGEGTVNANIFHAKSFVAQKLRVKLSDVVHFGQDHSDQVWEQSSLADYLGFPVITQSQDYDPLQNLRYVDILPFQAYQLIYNEFYRDENFQDEIEIFKDYDGANGSDIVDAMSAMEGVQGAGDISDRVYELFKLRQRNWEKDYFTSALPFPQRGQDTTLGSFDSRIYPYPSDAHHLFDVVNNKADVDAANIANMLELSSQNNISVNELRRALAVQKFKEKLARYGSRYTEFLRGLFGVKPKDKTIQRPEYLGGGRMPIVFGEVLQTSQTTQDSALGEYGGRGIGANSSQMVSKYCEEHGFIMGILSVMPKPDYCQGWPRMYKRWNKFDYYLPDFANIGEQEITQDELVFGNTARDSNLFGYQSRYAEYKYMPNRICGDFRDTMKDWHMARMFRYGEDNMLNADFLRVNNEEMDRIFNFRLGKGYDHLWLQIYNNVNALLPMPKFGTPKL